MFIIDKYIIRRCILPFLYCFSCFVLLAILVDLFEHGDDMIEKAMPFKIFITYYFYYICATLPHIAPMTVLLTTLYVMSSFIRHNELTAMMSGGIHVGRFVVPFLLLALILSLVLIIVNESIATRSASKITEIKKKHLYFDRVDDPFENLTKIGEGNRMFLIEKYAKKEKTMQYLIMLEFGSNPTYLLRRTNARKCVWDNNTWIATDASITTYDRTGNIIKKEELDKKILNIVEDPKYFSKGKKETAEMTYPELRSYIQKLDKCNYSTFDNKIDLYNKISIPFASFFVVVLGIPFAFLFINFGVMMNFAISIALGLGYVVLFAVFTAFGRGGFIPPFFSSWSANMLFGLTGLLLFFKKTRT